MRSSDQVPALRAFFLAFLCLSVLLACGGGPASGSAAATTLGAPVSEEPAASPQPGAVSLTVERLDDGAECAALVPASAPEPITVRLTAPAGGTCLGGTADGTGAVALGVRDAAGSVTWHATSGDGRPQGTFAAQALVSAPDGWQGLASDGALVDHVSIAPDGRVRRASAISPDPGAAHRLPLAAGAGSLGRQRGAVPIGDGGGQPLERARCVPVRRERRAALARGGPGVLRSRRGGTLLHGGRRLHDGRCAPPVPGLCVPRARAGSSPRAPRTPTPPTRRPPRPS